MSDSGIFDDLYGSDDTNDTDDRKNNNRQKYQKYKTINTSEFILVLLFIFISVVLGIIVQAIYF